MNNLVFMHEMNLKSKISSNYKNHGKEIKEFYENIYLPLRNKLLLIDFGKKEIDIFKNVSKMFDEYLNKLEKLQEKYNITSQSKLRSSFLEEISVYLFHNNKFVKNNELGIFNKGIFAGLKMGDDFKVHITTKDVDFCIGRKINIQIDDDKKTIIMPIVAVEVKTYLDATMFGEVQFSSKAIKNATQNVKTYVLMETNDVSIEKIISARYEKVLDEMFVLRFSTNTPIAYEALADYYNEITTSLYDIKAERKVVVPGRLINPDVKILDYSK